MTNLDASPYVGASRCAELCMERLRKGARVSWCKTDGEIVNAQIANLYVTEYLERVEVDTAGAGEVVAISGIEDITIGETLSDPDDPKPLPLSRLMSRLFR